jgi:hypothetical protein
MFSIDLLFAHHLKVPLSPIQGSQVGTCLAKLICAADLLLRIYSVATVEGTNQRAKKFADSNF